MTCRKRWRVITSTTSGMRRKYGRPRCVNTPAALTTTVPLENDNGCKYSIRPDSGRTSFVAPRGRGRFRSADMSETTRKLPFREIPAEQRHLLMVAGGVDSTTALREAADLEDAVRRLLAIGTESGIDGSLAFLCEFALEVSCALRHATRDY